MKKLSITVYILTIFAIAGLFFGVEPFVESLYFEVYDVKKEFVEGTLDLIAADLEKVPAGKWPSRLNEIERAFGSSLHLTGLEIKDIPPDKLFHYSQGEMVDERNGEEVFRFYKKVGTSGRMLYLDLLPNQENEDLFEVLSVLFIFLIPALAWSFIIWRDLLKIQKAANAFGKGDFSVRVAISRFSSVSTLFHSFNNMAERIGRLISSHKELTNSVSHELRTPISRIKFGMEMLKDASNDQDRIRYIAGIDRDMNEIETLVEEMLTYARFDREPQNVHLENHDIVSWLESVIDIEQSSMHAGNKEIRLIHQTDRTFVRFEPRHMEWAVRNLIRNGCRYGAKRVEISLELWDGFCMIHVDDDGPGIPEQKRQEIFEPFVRLDDSRSRDSGGYGLGLAIVNRISQWHGGKAEATASRLGGARFTVKWPRI